METPGQTDGRTKKLVYRTLPVTTGDPKSDAVISSRFLADQ